MYQDIFQNSGIVCAAVLRTLCDSCFLAVLKLALGFLHRFELLFSHLTSLPFIRRGGLSIGALA